MKARIITGLLLVQLVSCGQAFAGEPSPKIEAVKQYLQGDDYPEVLGKKSYRMKVVNVIEADLDDDGKNEVVLHVMPHYRQSPTIIIFTVSKKLKVTRITEGLAPGPLVALTGEFLDSHTLGEAVDMTFGEGKIRGSQRREIVKTSLENMGGVVEYSNFFHMDGRKGRGAYVDMTSLAKPPEKENCENFEFSMPDAVTVMRKKDGSGNYLLATVGDLIYTYKIHEIRADGFLEKTLTVTKTKK